MTDPDGTVVLDEVVTAPSVRPAPVSAVVAALCVEPTTFGTATDPDETTRSTARVLPDSVPAIGVWLITDPDGTVRLDTRVTVPTVSPAATMALLAAVCVNPATFGTTRTTSIVTFAVAVVNKVVSAGVNSVESGWPSPAGRIVPAPGV